MEMKINPQIQTAQQTESMERQKQPKSFQNGEEQKFAPDANDR